MNHQITLVGGQWLPVYLGIKEYQPDHIHFVVSEESRNRIASIRDSIGEDKITVYFCDPYNFSSVANTIENIISGIGDHGAIQINLTGGTKIMFLAAQSIIQNKKIRGFYIDQNETVLFVPEFTPHKLTCSLTVQEFLQMSGHTITSSKSFDDFSESEVKEAFAIRDFITIHDTVSTKVNAALRKIINASKGSMPKKDSFSLAGGIELAWDCDNIHLKVNGKTLLALQSRSARTFFFYAGWWEYVVADAIRRWEGAKEIYMQCEIPFKESTGISKNEIDILVNLGKKLIFIECKSGNITPNEINKMKIVRDTYGGLISKTMLVSRYKPSPEIMEKCDELHIDTFFLYDNKTEVNKLESLKYSLEKLESKLSIF